MERAWRAVPLAVAAFALGFIGWMGQMLRLSWLRDDSWAFTVTVASAVIPIFLVFLWLAGYVLWGIAREGRAGASGSGHGGDARPAPLTPGREGRR